MRCNAQLQTSSVSGFFFKQNTPHTLVWPATGTPSLLSSDTQRYVLRGGKMRRPADREPNYKPTSKGSGKRMHGALHPFAHTSSYLCVLFTKNGQDQCRYTQLEQTTKTASPVTIFSNFFSRSVTATTCSLPELFHSSPNRNISIPIPLVETFKILRFNCAYCKVQKNFQKV
jgi:hypothetical protein